MSCFSFFVKNESSKDDNVLQSKQNKESSIHDIASLKPNHASLKHTLDREKIPLSFRRSPRPKPVRGVE